MVLSNICGRETLKKEATSPRKIPMMIGFLRIPIQAVLMRSVVFCFWAELLSKVRMITAKILYKGTDPMIISGAICAVP